MRRKMPYITSVERRGIEKGLQQGLQRGEVTKAQDDIVRILEFRFEDVAQKLRQIIEKLDDTELLGKLLLQAVSTPSLDEFESVVSQYVTDDESKEEEE